MAKKKIKKLAALKRFTSAELDFLRDLTAEELTALLEEKKASKHNY